jgi:hypothetical protein
MAHPWNQDTLVNQDHFVQSSPVRLWYGWGLLLEAKRGRHLHGGLQYDARGRPGGVSCVDVVNPCRRCQRFGQALIFDQY